MYSDLNITSERKITQTCWRDKELLRLAKMTPEFKVSGTELFGRYKASGMGTQKRHMVDHIVSASEGYRRP